MDWDDVDKLTHTARLLRIAKRERAKAIRERDTMASALRVAASRLVFVPKHLRTPADDDAINYAIEALALIGGDDS